MTGALLLAAALAAAPAPVAGSNVSVMQPTKGPVVSLLGDVRVAAPVIGDVVALGGNVTLDPGADITGEVVSIGGTISGRGTVRGRAVAIGALGMGATTGTGGYRTAWGIHLMRLGGWLLLGSLVVVLLPRVVRGGARRLHTHPARTLLIGVVTLAVWLAAMVLAAVVVRSPIGAALLLTGAGLLLLAKTVGVVIAAWWVAERAVRVLPASLAGELPRVGLALAFLVALSLLPAVGTAAWVLANLVGIGAVAWEVTLRLPAGAWRPFAC